METIKIKELEAWLVEYLFNSIRGCEAEDSPEFNAWAKSYPKDAVETIVGMEFENDWGYDERSEIPMDEAKEYANAVLQRILSSWYL